MSKTHIVTLSKHEKMAKFLYDVLQCGFLKWVHVTLERRLSSSEMKSWNNNQLNII